MIRVITRPLTEWSPDGNLKRKLTIAEVLNESIPSPKARLVQWDEMHGNRSQLIRSTWQIEDENP